MSTNLPKKIIIIAEIGINHNGRIDEAIKLINIAADAGVWGVKFQYRNLENFSSNLEHEIGDEILDIEIKKNYLHPNDILQLTKHAKSLNLKVGISFFDIKDLDDFEGKIDEFNFFKTPSIELMNKPLLDRLLSFKKHVFIALGSHNEKNIELILSDLKSDNWTPLHCVSNYPLLSINSKLGYLNHLKNKWKKSVGYSSHDTKWENNLLAMQLGASVIERHITLDKNAKGLDHSSSSTPEEFRSLVFFADNIKQILSGDEDKSINQGEKMNLQNLGRSFYAIEDIEKGQSLSKDKIKLLSPRTGISHSDISQYENQQTIRRIKKGSILKASHFRENRKVDESALEFAKENTIALPVRLHDYLSVHQSIPINSYEFHLSFKESLSKIEISKLDRSFNYSIHAPDYINSESLINPFSKDKEQMEISCKILNNLENFAKYLQDFTGRKAYIVTSLSEIEYSKDTFYKNFMELIHKYKHRGVYLLPQWLPPYAWYFGGSVKINVLNNMDDVRVINDKKIPICMDVSHLCMGESFFNFDAKKILNDVREQIFHMHISDATGFDGEGVLFGDGDKKNLSVIRKSLEQDCMKVIEVWQGHLNNFDGFINSINSFSKIFNDK